MFNPLCLFQLEAAFDTTHEVELLNSNDAERLHLLGRPDLGVTFTKVCVWTLTTYDKIVFMDADMLALKNLDDLFDQPELSGAPDVGWPDCFNSGLFVCTPNLSTYDALLRRAQLDGSFDGGDQGLLNQHFKNWNRLSFLYNVVPGAFYSYSPAFRHFGNDIKAVHFIGPDKPWRVGRPGSGDSGSEGEGRNLRAYWWTVHDAYRSRATSTPTWTSSSPSSSIARPVAQMPGVRPPPTPPVSMLPPSPWERVESSDSNSSSDERPVFDGLRYPLSALDAKSLTVKVESDKARVLNDVLHELRMLNQVYKHHSSLEATSSIIVDDIQARIGRLTTILIKYKHFP